MHSICAETLLNRRMIQTCKETMCFKENEEYDKCWKVEGSMALTRSATAGADKNLSSLEEKNIFNKTHSTLPHPLSKMVLFLMMMMMIKGQRSPV